jgi:hypothetical protein
LLRSSSLLVVKNRHRDRSSRHHPRARVAESACPLFRCSVSARDWRNRRLAHLALPPLPGDVAKLLATKSRQHVEDALAELSGPFHN